MQRALRHFCAVAAAASIACAGAAAQGDENAAADAAIACLDIEETEARLACLEGAAQELKATRVRRETAEESAAADAATAPVVADDASEEDRFGAETLASTKKAIRERDEATRLNSRVVELRFNAVGDVTAVLENGQVWRQLASDSAVIRPTNKGKVFTVTIRRGPFGNYIMRINELKRAIRVRRIK